MKKILIACSALLIAVGTYGQGQVAFANTTTTLLMNGNTGASVTGAGTYKVGLYVGSVGTAEAALAIVGVTTNNNLPGRFNGGNPYALPSPTYPAGTPLTFQIRAWTGAAGSDYESALAAANANPALGYIGGVSGLGQVTPTAPPALVPALFGTGAGQLNSGITLNTLAVVPEPSSIALGLLGLGAIALFRRRK